MKRFRKKKFLLILVVLVLAAGGGGFAYLQMSSGSAAAAKEPEIVEPQKGQHGVMLALEDRVINLRTSSPFKYVKVGVTVEMRPKHAEFYAMTGEARHEAEKEELASLGEARPMLLDAVGTVVAATDPAGLITPAGRSRLKEELLTEMRSALGKEAVLHVYLTNLVMQ